MYGAVQGRFREWAALLQRDIVLTAMLEPEETAVRLNDRVITHHSEAPC